MTDRDRWLDGIGSLVPLEMNAKYDGAVVSPLDCWKRHTFRDHDPKRKDIVVCNCWKPGWRKSNECVCRGEKKERCR